ncbi:MAG: hypothetical protein GXP08_13920 [Gammaproteobacteria bacterium]|nr:hypothetical protein [Gammaproteobacteria bacterium]
MNIPNKSSVDDCWNRKGVWGREMPKCDKLAEVIHCRNCSVYWKAGRAMLDRNVPVDYVRQWTNEVAVSMGEASSPSESIITFRLNKEWYSLSTRYFLEVSQVRKIHHIPHHRGRFILGVVNVSGVIRLCFSLSYLLGVHTSSENEVQNSSIYKRFVVVSIKGNAFVFPVNEIGGILHYDAKDLLPATTNTDTEKAKLIVGVLKINSRRIACLDAEQLYSSAEDHLGE